ncbi:adenosine deaminase [Starkeya sp. ORNL1]|uniref:adenosine deaminase n=1 Tax=Starkeya sp. ORNL1 TaxID=2709380 RepID=UPI0014632A0B|nr:adenosine deaminase [Starkeya sp. ORNL1]QJP13576.1 adenosine deaminase [Starkeya sp. ORNL1]
MRRRIWAALFLLAALALAWRMVAISGNLPEVVTAARFEELRADSPQLRAFLRRMPKGADLHTHLSGAVYAERFITWAVRDGLCLRRADWAILPRPNGAAADQPCGADPAVVPIADAVSGPRGQTTYDLLLDALSMRWFLPTPAIPSGHDQFFGTFGKFNAATGGSDWQATLARMAEMIADQLRQYDADAVQYAEFMVTLLEGDERRQLSQAIGTETEPAAMLAALQSAGLAQSVTGRAQQVAELVKQIDALLDCGSERRKPGCGVTYRFIAQVNRNSAPADVFTQTAHAAALVRAAPHSVVGLNYVGPEDYRISLRDYRMHMKWIGFLTGSDVPVALHAGELWLGLVPPPDLDFHIREAVEVAGARRIGHGTAVGFERDMNGLLAEMRRRGVTVEIALTSSDVILGVRGTEHPITTYLNAGVPVVLATDDAGVSRIDLSNEYYRAAHEHGLGYRKLKSLAHNAITHAFLGEDEKRRELEKLDRSFADFERSVAHGETWVEWVQAVALGAVLTR